MKVKCIGPILCPERHVLLSRETYQALAIFIVLMRGTDDDPFCIVHDMFERFYACRTDCDACGTCKICSECPCELIDYDGEVVDLDQREYQDDFGEDPKATMRRFEQAARNGVNVRPKGHLLDRLMWLWFAREIYMRDLAS